MVGGQFIDSDGIHYMFKNHREPNVWTHHAVTGVWDVHTFHQQLHSSCLETKHKQEVVV